MTRSSLWFFPPHTTRRARTGVRASRCALPFVAPIALGVLFAGCFGEDGSPSDSSATNFLGCDRVEDCDHPAAVACDADGFCLDDRGERIADAGGTKTAGAGGTASAGSGGAGGAGAGGSGATGGSGGNTGSLVCAGVDCGSGSHCCTDCGGHQCVPDGTTCPDVECPVAACVRVGDDCCDPFPGDGPNYCEGSLTCCADNTCATTCDGGTGAPDLTGDVECGTQPCVTGQVCAHPCCGGDGSPCTPPPPFCVDYEEACSGDFCSTMSCTGSLDRRDILCTCA